MDNRKINTIINNEIANRKKEISLIIKNLEDLKNIDKSKVSEQMKVNLIKYATEINEHKAVINVLERILLQIKD